MKRVERAYFAGLLDGEGYLGLLKTPINNFYKPAIKVANTNEDIIEELKSKFGGNIYKRIVPIPNKDSWSWEIKDRKRVKRCLNKVMPYLKIKEKQGKMLMEYIKIPTKDVRTNSLTFNKELYAEKEKIYNKLKALNKKGKQSPAETE